MITGIFGIQMIFGGFIMKDKKSRILIYVLSAACAVLLCTVMILAVSLMRNAGTGSEAVSSHTEQQEQDTQRILFVGDSRTIDMFADSDDEISGFDSGDGITVCAKHGGKFAYMSEAVARYGVDRFDVLVTCMGANDDGDFQNYSIYYDGLLSQGKKLIVCTVGPTNDEDLFEDNVPRYLNKNMLHFNESLTAWAEKNDVPVIDVYGFVSSSKTIRIDPDDGIHYLPRPTSELWDFISDNINQRVTGDGSV